MIRGPNRFLSSKVRKAKLSSQKIVCQTECYTLLSQHLVSSLHHASTPGPPITTREDTHVANGFIIYIVLTGQQGIQQLKWSLVVASCSCSFAQAHLGSYSCAQTCHDGFFGSRSVYAGCFWQHPHLTWTYHDDSGERREKSCHEDTQLNTDQIYAVSERSQ